MHALVARADLQPIITAPADGVQSTSIDKPDLRPIITAPADYVQQPSVDKPAPVSKLCRRSAGAELRHIITVPADECNHRLIRLLQSSSQISNQSSQFLLMQRQWQQTIPGRPTTPRFLILADYALTSCHST